MTARPTNNPLQRAGKILARIPTPRRGRHAVKPTRRQRCTKAAVTVAAASLAIAGTLAVLTPDSPPPTPVAAVATIPASEAETIFVAELEAAGIPLTPQQAETAVGIAREHVAHGHLVGMREPIRQDLRAAFPDFTDEQVEIAKVAVEHHFRFVTGRAQ